jgi:hypothetical protein
MRILGEAIGTWNKQKNSKGGEASRLNGNMIGKKLGIMVAMLEQQ